MNHITPPQKKRIAIVVDTLRVPAWVKLSVEKMASTPSVDIVAVIPVGNACLAAESARDRRAKAIYSKFDERLYPQSPSALARVALLSGLDAGAVTVLQLEGAISSDSAALKSLHAMHIDLIVSYLGRRPPALLNAGGEQEMWAHYLGGWPLRHSGDSGFFEVIHSEDVTESGLYRVGDTPDEDQPLYRSFAATHTTSVHANNNPIYWKAASYAQRVLTQGPQPDAVSIDSGSMQSPVHPTVKGSEFLAHAGQSVLRNLHRRFHFEQWALCFQLENEISLDFSVFQEIRPPADRYWADPFVMKREHVYYIFYEELYYANPRGHISVIELHPDGQCRHPRPVLKRPYHLSYPFLLEHGDTLYMMPECNENHTVDLYRCVSFPDEWVLACTLLAGVDAVDATLIEYQGRWWLFANVRENEGADFWDELYLFSSETLLGGRFEPHPLNPIISDVRRSRPAGRIQQTEEGLFRVSQICSRSGYGYGLNINKIETLTETAYEERCVQTIEPHWRNDVAGVHTINHADGCTVIDALLKRTGRARS